MAVGHIRSVCSQSLGVVLNLMEHHAAAELLEALNKPIRSIQRLDVELSLSLLLQFSDFRRGLRHSKDFQLGPCSCIAKEGAQELEIPWGYTMLRVLVE